MQGGGICYNHKNAKCVRIYSEKYQNALTSKGDPLMKRTKQQTAWLLLVAMLAGMMVACGSTETTAETEQTTDTAPITETEETLYELDDLPADLYYDGTTITTLGRDGMTAVEFFTEELNGELVNDAIYHRNLNVEERLGVKLEYVMKPGAYDGMNEWMGTVTSSVQAGDQAYDMVAGYSMATASLAVQHALLQLNDLPYLNFDKPWWPDSLLSEATCAGKLYVCSGDISTYMIYYMYAVYFNKDMLTNYNLEDPYDLVFSGEWTLDKMLEMSTGIYQDLNGNGKKDYEDQFGLDCYNVFVDSLYFGVGLWTTDKAEGDIPVLCAEFGGEKAHWLLETITNFMNTNDGVRTKDGELDSNKAMFKESRSLFSFNEFQFAAIDMRDAEIEYGILPVPKYDADQKGYRTVMSFPYSLYGIPVDVKDSGMSAAVMEALASESYRTVTPALFETGMKVKYAQDDETSQVFDIIRSSAVFDFGRMFAKDMEWLTYSLFRYAPDSNWMSTYAKSEAKMTTLLDKIVTALTE